MKVIGYDDTDNIVCYIEFRGMMSSRERIDMAINQIMLLSGIQKITIDFQYGYGHETT